MRLTRILPLAGLLLLPAAAHAQYPCPADPGFCYVDTNDNVCFDAGTDIGPINTQLQAGSVDVEVDFGEPTGGIVCPPSVKKLEVDTSSDWVAPGDISFFSNGFKIDDDVPLELRSTLSNVTLNGVVISGGSRSRFTGTAVAGSIGFSGKATMKKTAGDNNSGFTLQTFGPDDITIGARSSVSADCIFVISGGDGLGGTVTLQDKAKLKQTSPLSAVCQRLLVLSTDGGSIEMSSPNLGADGDMEIGTPGTVDITGKAVIKAVKNANSVVRIGESTLIPGRPNLSIAAMVASANGSFQLVANDLTVGLPGLSGKVGTSKVKIKPTTGNINFDATGVVDLERVQLQANTIDIATTGTTLGFLDGKGLGVPLLGSTFDVSATGGGSTCDLTDSQFKNTTVTTNCGTVIP